MVYLKETYPSMFQRFYCAYRHPGGPFTGVLAGLWAAGLWMALAVTMLFPTQLLAQTRLSPKEMTGPVTIPVKIANGHIFVQVFLLNQASGQSNNLSLEVSLDEPSTLVLKGETVVNLG